MFDDLLLLLYSDLLLIGFCHLGGQFPLLLIDALEQLSTLVMRLPQFPLQLPLAPLSFL